MKKCAPNKERVSRTEDISLATAAQGFLLRPHEGCDTGINWQLRVTVDLSKI